jgi:hypothetical protein
MVQSLSSSARQIDNPICGYHIHKDAWDSFFDYGCLYTRNLKFARHPELAICPFFNFTFCAFFDLQNSYPLSHPPPPNCFCGLPVTMRHDNRGKLMFTCPNYLIDGARPKCTWKLWASEVPFQRPNGCTHPLQKQGTDRLLEPSRQIQSRNRKRETFNNHNSVRVENNIGYNNNNGERFKLYHQQQQREIRFNGDKYSSNRRDPNHHSSERLDHNHRRERDFRSRNYNYQNQQPTSSNRSSSVSRRISNGTGSSYSQKGWDPGRSRYQPRQQTIKGRKSPARWDNNDSSGSHHGDNSDGQIINKNSSTDQLSSESNKSLNVDEYNVDKAAIKAHLRSENGEPKGFRDEVLFNQENNINSNDLENQGLKPSVMVNNSNMEHNNGRNVSDKSNVKICLEKDVIEKSVFIEDNPQANSDSSLRPDYSEENGSLSSSNSSRLSIEVNLKEISYILTYDEFSQTKPACITNRAPNCNFVAETSRLLTENQKLTSENQSLISKQENDLAEKNNFVIQVERLKSEVNRLLGKAKSEQKLRQSSQKKLMELQAHVADVTKEIDELRSLMEKEKEESAMGNMKCKVCFEENITYALLPCYHFVLCGKCSQKIDKCVICRKPKESVVRIYLG